MTVVVMHKKIEKIYVLIGTGYGTYVNKDASTSFGYLLPYEETGEIPVAAVSDSDGNIIWYPTSELRVIQVDGVNVTDLFNNLNELDYNTPTKKNDKCPACDYEITDDDKICPSCGLTLII